MNNGLQKRKKLRNKHNALATKLTSHIQAAQLAQYRAQR